MKFADPDIAADAFERKALNRLDQRFACSTVGAGFLGRMQFADACASLWLGGELVHLEDLVLHDVGQDLRAPTHELTIARDVLRSRRCIVTQPPAWALTPGGSADPAAGGTVGRRRRCDRERRGGSGPIRGRGGGVRRS